MRKPYNQNHPIDSVEREVNGVAESSICKGGCTLQQRILVNLAYELIPRGHREARKHKLAERLGYISCMRAFVPTVPVVMKRPHEVEKVCLMWSVKGVSGG